MKISKIKKAMSCKDVAEYTIDKNKITNYIPKAGDVAIFKVITLGKHIAIEADCARNMSIFPGDYIMSAFGNRYATEQFEGYVPDECLQMFHILGMGGAVGIIKSTNVILEKIGPTDIRIVGYAVDKKGDVINTKYYKQKADNFNEHLQKNTSIILSLGSSMDSGKTTTAGFLCRGIKSLGKKVAYIKLTGTVFSKDKNFVFDCGADEVLDFSDFGFPSTFMCDKEELLDLYQSLINKINLSAPDYIIIEIADGLFQRETNFLLKDKRFMSTVEGVVYSCGDSLSAIQGIQILSDLGFKPKCLSGLFTMSPLLIEEVKANCDVPVYTIDELMVETYAEKIVNNFVKRIV